MYKITRSEKYDLLVYKEGFWIVQKTFYSLDDLLDYTASRSRRIFIPYLYEKTEISNTILENLNLNGNDTNCFHSMVFANNIWVCKKVETYIRDYMVISSDGRIIDLRYYSDEIEKRFLEREKRPLSYWWRRTPGYVFRRGPVPWTGRCYHHYRGIRNEKNWFRNYRLDRIPEYKEYVRDKAKVPNVWDTEPFQGRSKSWKDNCKCRHQWEKHKK